VAEWRTKDGDAQESVQPQREAARLAAIINRQPVCSSETQLLARILCGNDDDPQLMMAAKRS
jgi:hypothetical protein